jgi:hypothetical protein
MASRHERFNQAGGYRRCHTARSQALSGGPIASYDADLSEPIRDGNKKSCDRLRRAQSNWEKTSLKREVKPPFHLVIFAAALALFAIAPRAARADFFEGARRTFQTDIPHFFTHDVPHFFQDDIPCAFGGRPSNGTTASCNAQPDKSKSRVPVEPRPIKTEPARPPQ